MGFFIFSNNGKINYGIKNYIADTEKDLEQIPTRYPGSMVYVIDTQKFYMVNQNGTWVETKGGSGSSEIDETQVNALIDAKIAQVPTLPDPTGSDNQIPMTQDGEWTLSTIPEGQTVIIDETLSVNNPGHAISNTAVTSAINTINTSITAINEAGYQTATDVQNIVTEELGDITSFEYYLCKIGEYSLETGIPIAEDLDEAPDTQHIYLTPGANDNLNMYAYINNDFVFLGTTEMDMSNYYDITEINTLLSHKADTTDLETLETNIPTKLGDLTNDQNFITLADVNNAGYLTSSELSTAGFLKNGNNISLLNNNAGYLTSANLPTPIHSDAITLAATDTQFASAKAEFDTRRMITVKSAVDGVVYKIQVVDGNNFDINTLPDDNVTITFVK